MPAALWLVVGFFFSPLLGWLFIRLLAGVLNDLIDLIGWIIFRDKPYE